MLRLRWNKAATALQSVALPSSLHTLNMQLVKRIAFPTHQSHGKSQIILFYLRKHFVHCVMVLSQLGRLVRAARVCLKAASAAVASGVTGVSRGVNGGSVVEQWTRTRQTDQEHEVSTWCSLHIVCFITETSSNHVKAFRGDNIEGAILYEMLMRSHKQQHMIKTPRLELLKVFTMCNEPTTVCRHPNPRTQKMQHPLANFVLNKGGDSRS